MAERTTSFAKQLSKEDRALAALERAGFSQPTFNKAADGQIKAPEQLAS